MYLVGCVFGQSGACLSLHLLPCLVDALEKTAYFTLGCKSLTVGSDHQPPIPIINSTDMEKVMTPKLIRLKGKLLRWGLRVVYIPGKFLGGTDALSRYGVSARQQ